MDSLWNFEFLDPLNIKDIQYINLKFVGTVIMLHMPFQYSELK